MANPLQARLATLLAAPPPFRPNPGSQQMVIDLIRNTTVDEIWYMGEAGGGKSHLALGLAATLFQNSIIFRRELTDLTGREGMVEKSKELWNAVGEFNGTTRVWDLRAAGKRRSVQFSGCANEDDKYAHQGRPHDLYVFDEITQYTPTMPAYITGWRRSPDPTQRTLVLFTGNPPTDAAGGWVTERVRAWVDPGYARPARAGEIRYFVSKRDLTEIEVEGSEPVEVEGERKRPVSRTFVPSVLRENPTYASGAYSQVLDAMPEPLRSILMRGDFNAARRDGEWQVIPSAWVRAAMRRWTPEPPDERLTAIGCDIAHGGADNNVLARRFGTWFAPLITVPGVQTPDGVTAAALITPHLIDGAGIAVVDYVGFGSECFGVLKADERVSDRVVAFIGSQTDKLQSDRAGQLTFGNLRAEAYWHMREALDPVSGDGLALPPNERLHAGLTAPTYFLRAGGIFIEKKEDIKKRLGYSPDEADAVVMGNSRIALEAMVGGGGVFGPVRRRARGF